MIGIKQGADTPKYSKIQGSLIGGAVGDALGYTVEFSSLTGIKHLYGKNGITRYELDHRGLAIISDDTQMTLFTAVGLLYGITRGTMRGVMGPIECYVFDIGYRDWLRTQQYNSVAEFLRHTSEYDIVNSSWLKDVDALYSRRAPGMTCLSALESGEMGSIEKPINQSKGCGGVMRVAPVGIFYTNYFKSEEEIVMTGAKIAAITHGHELGYIPAGMLSHLIWSIIEDSNKESSLLDHITRSLTITIECFKGTTYINRFKQIINLAIELSKHSMPDHEAIVKLGEGWVAEEALAIAIYSALKHSDNFEDAIASSVNHSGDSDSTGSICGNIIGAYLGFEAIPQHYTEYLELRDVILEICEDLHTGCRCVDRDSLEYDNEIERDRWVEKYVMGNRVVR